MRFSYLQHMEGSKTDKLVQKHSLTMTFSSHIYKAVEVESKG